MKHFKSIVLLVVLFPIAIEVFLNGCGGGKEDVIKIGAILPLTGSASEFGIGNKNGIDIALEKINGAGGINERNVQIIYEDSKGEPKIGINAFNKIIGTGKINSLFLCMSSVSMAIKPLAERNALLTFCVAAAPDLTKDARNIFRLLPTTTLQAKKIAEFISEKRIQEMKISLFYIQDDFGNSFKNSFSIVANSKGLSVISENEFTKDGTSFRNIVVKALNQKPNIVVIGGYGSSLGILIKQLREAGYKGPIYGTPDMGYPKVLEVVKENLGEAYIIDFDIENSRKEMLDFVKNYKNKFNSEPSMDAIIGYDGINLLLEAEKLLESKKLKSLREALLLIKEFNGLVGKIEITENGDIIFPLKFKKL